LVRLSELLKQTNKLVELAKLVFEIGAAIEKHNLRALKFYNLASKSIQVKNPHARAHMTH
jgi:hypothetical protein